MRYFPRRGFLHGSSRNRTVRRGGRLGQRGSVHGDGRRHFTHGNFERSVLLQFRVGLPACGVRAHPAGAGAIGAEMCPNQIRYVVIERAGVRFLLGHAERGQQFDNLVRGNFQLPGQLVNADFTHMEKTAMAFEKRRLADVIRVLHPIRFTFLDYRNHGFQLGVFRSGFKPRQSIFGNRRFAGQRLENQLFFGSDDG